MKHWFPACIVSCLCVACLSASATAAPKIPDKEYVTVKDGHLTLDGKRVRYWGVIGAFTPRHAKDDPVNRDNPSAEEREKKLRKQHRDLVATADRLRDLGFNMLRLWHGPTNTPFRKGDGSRDDQLAFWLNELDKRGIKIWNSATNRGAVGIEDVSVVDDPATAKAWKEAVGELVSRRREGPPRPEWKRGVGGLLARMWDRRIEKVGIEYRRKCADFRNPYRNNIRWGDDPQMVIWELSNEQRWMRKMLNGQWKGLPRFFREQLLAQWHGFLKSKYGSEDNLRTAWLALLPGESLDKGTVQLLPLKTEADVIIPYDPAPHVLALLKETAKEKYSRDDFHPQRGGDVLQFFVELLVEHKKRERAALKGFGKSCRLSPCVSDAGDAYDIQSLWMYQHSDAVSMHNYTIGQHHDPQHHRYPWRSLLDEPPRLRGGLITYVTTQRIPDKPYVLYEVGYENPGKYRAEYPYQLAALASIQDFDAMCWHVMTNHVHNSDAEEPYAGAMDYTVPWNGNPEGLHYRHDEVMQSAMQGAAEVFKNMCLAPAPNPTTYIFGRKSLYDPASMDFGVSYGVLGRSVRPTTYRHGSRMYIDTTRETDSVSGPTITFGAAETMPLRPSKNIEFDWKRAHMKFDSPRTATYVGFFAEHGGPVEFGNGVVLDKVTVNNPKGIAYPVEDDELYVAFSLTARDGKPLTKTKDVFLSLVSTSFNSGFELDHSKILLPDGFKRNKGCMPSAGTAPVLVTRAGAEITAPALNGMSYTMLDFHMREVGKGTVKKGMIVVPADKKVYGIVLKR